MLTRKRDTPGTAWEKSNSVRSWKSFVCCSDMIENISRSVASAESFSPSSGTSWVWIRRTGGSPTWMWTSLAPRFTATRRISSTSPTCLPPRSGSFRTRRPAGAPWKPPYQGRDAGVKFRSPPASDDEASRDEMASLMFLPRESPGTGPPRVRGMSGALRHGLLRRQGDGAGRVVHGDREVVEEVAAEDSLRYLPLEWWHLGDHHERPVACSAYIEALDRNGQHLGVAGGSL